MLQAVTIIAEGLVAAIAFGAYACCHLLGSGV
jgi:hypothetical protein